MKKVLCAIMAVLMLVGLCGCGDLLGESGPAFSVGSWNGNVYTNDFASITYTEPDGWSHASPDELLEMLGASIEMGADDNELAAKIAEMSNYYALHSANANGTGNAQILFENLAITGNKSMEAQEYLELVTSQLESEYAAMELETSLGEVETIQIGGNDYLSVTIECSMDGTVLLEQVYAVRKIDKYMASIIITASLDVTADSIIDCFE